MNDSGSTGQTSGLEELLRQRRRKLDSIREKEMNPFDNSFRPGARNIEVKEACKSLDPGAEPIGDAPDFSIAGRIVRIRSFGRATFLVVRDMTGTIQVLAQKNVLGPDVYAVLKLVDEGDFLGVKGKPMKTRTGEDTLQARELRLLTKALRPLPGEKWHGLQDIETRYRRRAADLAVNEDVRQRFLSRSLLISALRRFLEERGFLEVETPMMHPIPGGATARPFVTHHNALDMDLYLRIAPELYLKRLVVGGMERVFEINRNFRNEGLSRLHNPEFTMLEFYMAYATFEDLMDMTEQMLSFAAEAVCKTSKITYMGEEFDFSPPFRRLTMRQAVADALSKRPELGFDSAMVNDEQAFMKFTDEKGDVLFRDEKENPCKDRPYGKRLALVFEALCEGSLRQPTFITEFPVQVSPLSRRNGKDPRFVDRFELYIAGRELANAFSELNDPDDQRARFEEQARARAAGDEEAMYVDEDYLTALEFGMPPTAGEGIGVDRLAMLLTDAPSIRDVILFPLMRPER
ncbi:MAG: lysine--tRNA ligase [Deltaproteobacteria bacterium]|nr:lysine--tRNA ligase [Deltaproteobacteria bacterium]